MSDTVFPVLGIDRKRVRWEEHLHTLTPVEEVNGVYFKREDRFAPLGYGAINGTKLRQCIWLIDRFRRTHLMPRGVLSGSSIKSPQISMSAAVAKHFGLPSIQVIGATKAETAMRAENVAIGASLGARFEIQSVGYNPVLQSRVAELARRMTGYYHLEYGISPGVSALPVDIEAFHALGAEQVGNLPDDVETLYLPAGSCNSCISVLYGVARLRPKKLRTVVLFGIGPTRLDFIEQRLELLERVSGLVIRPLFRRDYRHATNGGALRGHYPKAPYTLRHFDLHATHFASYQDEMPCRFGDIDLHPTYEGKVMRYVQTHQELATELASGLTLFWIVGSRASREAMAPYGEPCSSLPLLAGGAVRAAPLLGTAANVVVQLVERERASRKPLGRGALHEEKALEYGMDFRDPRYRREVFHRFYEFHLRYRSHPGAVYYVLPHLARVRGWNLEDRLWFAFLNGNTQNPVTSLTIFDAFPTPGRATPPAFARWWGEHYDRLPFDTDRRYHKKFVPQTVEAYRKMIGGREQERFYAQFDGGFRHLWEFIEKKRGFPYFGRLSAFSFIEYLRISGLALECDSLFLDDLPGSKSHRNGLCKVLGRDDLDWHDSNPAFPGYSGSCIDWLTEEGALLLKEARARARGKPWEGDAGYFTLESALCTYKSWHRPNRRYPNVYNDLFLDRLRTAEKHGVDTRVFHEARAASLPPHLLLENNPRDPGCVPAKQNHYGLTGECIMMNREWPCFRNGFNDAVDA